MTTKWWVINLCDYNGHDDCVSFSASLKIQHQTFLSLWLWQGYINGSTCNGIRRLHISVVVFSTTCPGVITLYASPRVSKAKHVTSNISGNMTIFLQKSCHWVASGGFLNSIIWIISSNVFFFTDKNIFTCRRDWTSVIGFQCCGWEQLYLQAVYHKLLTGVVAGHYRVVTDAAIHCKSEVDIPQSVFSERWPSVSA